MDTFSSLFLFFYQRENIFRHFIGLISDFRHKGFSRKNLTKGSFSLIFISTQPAPVLGNPDLRYHLSRLNQNPQHLLQGANETAETVNFRFSHYKSMGTIKLP